MIDPKITIEVPGMEAVSGTVKRLTDEAMDFLGLICKPAAEEFGLAFRVG